MSARARHYGIVLNERARTSSRYCPFGARAQRAARVRFGLSCYDNAVSGVTQPPARPVSLLCYRSRLLALQLSHSSSLSVVGSGDSISSSQTVNFATGSGSGRGTLTSTVTVSRAPGRVLTTTTTRTVITSSQPVAYNPLPSYPTLRPDPRYCRRFEAKCGPIGRFLWRHVLGLLPRLRCEQSAQPAFAFPS